MTDAVIVSTARTPIGKAYRGAFNNLESPTMASHAIKAAVERAGVEPGEIDDVVMGAAMQPQGQIQVLSNIIDFGMNAQEAGDAARVRHDGSSEPTGGRISGGGTVCLESGFPAATAAGLARLGHSIGRADAGEGGFGGYQAIMRDSERKLYFGASESRKDGCALGY